MPSRRLRTVLLLLVAISAFVAAATHAQTREREAGRSYFDDSRYIEYIPGDMPLVISAPHGGMLRPDAIPDRGTSNAGCPDGKRIVTATDTDSDALARELQQRFFTAYGVRPYVIIAHISRRKVDLNRDLDEAACGNAAMVQEWHHWHEFIHEAMAAATAKFGGALYIDLHGHGHARQRLELGYALGAAQLKALYDRKTPADNGRAAVRDDEDGDTPNADAAHATLANLPALKSGKKSLRDLLFGDDAFGTLAANAGLDAVPSQQDPYPQAGELYFNGGYNARRYTGKDYPQVFGWQIETNRGARQAANRDGTARALMKALTEFMAKNTALKWKAD